MSQYCNNVNVGLKVVLARLFAFIFHHCLNQLGQKTEQINQMNSLEY